MYQRNRYSGRDIFGAGGQGAPVGPVNLADKTGRTPNVDTSLNNRTPEAGSFEAAKAELERTQALIDDANENIKKHAGDDAFFLNLSRQQRLNNERAQRESDLADAQLLHNMALRTYNTFDVPAAIPEETPAETPAATPEVPAATTVNKGGSIVGYNCGGSVDGSGKYNDGGKISIDPAKKGTFKAAATRAGMSGPAFANKVLSAPAGKYSPALRKKANFANNFAYKNAGGDIPQYANSGKLMNSPFDREGKQFDTVPAKLTPGEWIVDADSTAVFKPVLDKINKWEPGKPIPKGLMPYVNKKQLAASKSASANRIGDNRPSPTPDASGETHAFLGGLIPWIVANPGITGMLAGLAGSLIGNYSRRRSERHAAAAEQAGERFESGLTGLENSYQTAANKARGFGLHTTSTGGWGPNGYTPGNSTQNQPGTMQYNTLSAVGQGENAAQHSIAGYDRAKGQLDQNSWNAIGGAAQNIGAAYQAPIDAAAKQAADLATYKQKASVDDTYARELAGDKARIEADQIEQKYQNELAMNAAKAEAKANDTSSWSKDLTAGQSKNLSLYNEMKTGKDTIDYYENQEGFDPGSVSSQAKLAATRSKDGSISGMRAAILQNADPEALEYLKGQMKFITGKLRNESGAAIGADEWASELFKSIPSSRDEIGNAQAQRERAMRGQATLAGAPSVEAANKFYSDVDGSWYTPPANPVGPVIKTPAKTEVVKGIDKHLDPDNKDKKAFDKNAGSKVEFGNSKKERDVFSKWESK